MAGLNEGPAGPDLHDTVETARRNSWLGLRLFAVYLALYAGFVLVNAFAPSWMEVELVPGVNLAIAYGFGLIGAALILALIYGWLCRSPAASEETDSGR